MFEKQCFAEEGDVDIGFGVGIPVGLSQEGSEDIREIRRRVLGRRRIDLSNVGDLALAVLRYRQVTGQLSERVGKDGSALLAALTRCGRLVGRGSQLGLLPGDPVYGEFVDATTRRDVTHPSPLAFDWKEACSNAMVSNRDLLVWGAAPEDLVEVWIGHLVRDAVSGLAKAVFLTGDEADGNAVGGLGLCVSEASHSVGGIDAKSCPGWESQKARVRRGVGDIALTISERIGEHLRRARVPHEKPDVIVMPPDLCSEFEDSKHVWTKRDGKDLFYEGIRVLDDSECPPDLVYVLNTRYLGLVAHEAQNLGPIGGVRQPADRNAVWLILGWMGNMVVTSRRLQLVIRIEDPALIH